MSFDGLAMMDLGHCEKPDRQARYFRSPSPKRKWEDQRREPGADTLLGIFTGLKAGPAAPFQICRLRTLPER